MADFWYTKSFWCPFFVGGGQKPWAQLVKINCCRKSDLKFWFQEWSQKIRLFGPPVAELWPNIFQYISIYFSKSWLTQIHHKVHQKRKIVSWWICIELLVAFVLTRAHLRKPLKEMFLSEKIFGNLGSSSVILVDESLKALCLSSKMAYQHLFYLLSFWTYWHLKFTQGPTHFFNGNFRGC